MSKPPNRVSCWLPDEDVWLHVALDDLASQISEKEGLSTTKSDLIRQSLLKQFGHLKAKYVQANNNHS